MEIIFSSQALDDIDYWKKSGNKTIMNKITRLLEDITAHPFTGIGKPEPLRYDLAGYWSRRITSKHRIIYAVHEDLIEVYILSVRYHYTRK